MNWKDKTLIDAIDDYWPDITETDPGDFQLDLTFDNSHIQALEELHATPKVANWWQERIEYELRGAYMAGYEYLYYAEPRKELEFNLDRDQFEIQYVAIPSHVDWEGEHPALEKYSDWIWHEYDLSSMPTDKYRELVKGKN